MIDIKDMDNCDLCDDVLHFHYYISWSSGAERKWRCQMEELSRCKCETSLVGLCVGYAANQKTLKKLKSWEEFGLDCCSDAHIRVRLTWKEDCTYNTMDHNEM